MIDLFPVDKADFPEPVIGLAIEPKTQAEEFNLPVNNALVIGDSVLCPRYIVY